MTLSLLLLSLFAIGVMHAGVALWGALRFRDLALNDGSSAMRRVARTSVLVPAYNEENVVRECIERIAASRPAPMEIVVVDDGSTDSTSDVARSADTGEVRLRVIRRANGGKAAALRTAARNARGDYLVVVDADTLVNEETLVRLVAPFADEDVDAVAGTVEVYDRSTWIGAFQQLEYRMGLNLIRRAQSVFGCILTVPGAAGAFRRGAVEDAGGFSSDTLAEDTDITLAIQERGGRVVYASSATTQTEAPSDWGGLFRQRVRWSGGNLQCLHKHRALVTGGNRWLAYWGYPSMLLGYAFTAMAPLVWSLLIAAIASGNGWTLVPWLAVFVIVEGGIALISLRLDGRSVRDAWLIVPQRIAFSIVLAAAVWVATWRIVRGRRLRWNKLQRIGFEPLSSGRAR